MHIYQNNRRLLDAALNFCREKKINIFCHRCLEHTKRNIREESGRRDSVSGRLRLRNRELLGALIDWVMFTAFLPSDVEFHTFWSSVICRMEFEEKETDSAEPEMAAYLRKHT